MAVFSTTMKAYWRPSPSPARCCVCKVEGLPTFETGHKPRRAKEVDWWDMHYCAPCKKALPATAPE